MYDAVIIEVPHARLNVRRCSCGFQVSSPSAHGVVSGMSDHIQAVHAPPRVGPLTWQPFAAADVTLPSCQNSVSAGRQG